MIVDVKLNLFWRNRQFRVNLFVNKLELFHKLSPQVFIYLRNLSIHDFIHDVFVIFRWRQIRCDFAWSFKTGLPKSFFPRMEVNSQDWDLIISNNEELFCDVSQCITMSFTFELNLQCFENGSDVFDFIQRLFENGSNEGLLSELNKGFVAALICSYRFIKKFLYFWGDFVFR